MLQDIMPANMPSLQYRHEAPPRHAPFAEAPHLVGYPVVGLSVACQYIPFTISCCSRNSRNFYNSRWGPLRVFMPFSLILVISVNFKFSLGLLTIFANICSFRNSRNFLNFRNSRWGPLKFLCHSGKFS